MEMGSRGKHVCDDEMLSMHNYAYTYRTVACRFAYPTPTSPSHTHTHTNTNTHAHNPDPVNKFTERGWEGTLGRLSPKNTNPIWNPDTEPANSEACSTFHEVILFMWASPPLTVPCLALVLGPPRSPARPPPPNSGPELGGGGGGVNSCFPLENPLPRGT